MDYLDFSKEMARMDIKRNRNSVNVWRSIFVLNLVGVIINLFCAWHGGFVNTICAGSLIGNLFWITSQYFSSKQDLRFDQERLSHLEKMMEEKNIDGIMRQLDQTKKYYEDYARYQKVADKMNYVPSAVCRESKPQESASPMAEK